MLWVLERPRRAMSLHNMATRSQRLQLRSHLCMALAQSPKLQDEEEIPTVD